MYCGGDDIGAIVADIGTTSTRIGYAGDDYPRAYFPSCIGLTSNDENSSLMELENQSNISTTSTSTSNNNNHNNNKLNYSFDLTYFKENMSVEHAIKDGLVSNWDHLEKLWEYGLGSSLKVDTKETPVLIAEKSYNSSLSRQKMCELMFERFNAPALFISKDAVLSCFASGKTTGVVVDCGASGTVVTPVSDGWAETSAISRSIVGGRYMDTHLLSIISHILTTQYHRSLSKPSFYYTKSHNLTTGQTSVQLNPLIKNVHNSYNSYMTLDMIRDLKETICRTAESSTCLTEGDPRYVNIPLLPYTLPDGTLIEVGGERFYTPELLFDTLKGGYKSSEHLISLGIDSSNENSLPYSTDSIQKLILDSILRCEPSNQSNIISTMIVTGGNSCYDGMPERIKFEVDKILHLNVPSWKMKMICPTSNERIVCPWLGGSILASLGSLHDMWMAKSEYDEYGASLIDRKCP